MYRNRQSSLSQLKPYIPLPKYFGSEWSYAQFRIPSQSSHISISAPPSRPPTADVVDEEKCVVAWIQIPSDSHDSHPQHEGKGHDPTLEYQLIALTYTGGWYRLSLPSSTTPPSTHAVPTSTTSPVLGAPGVSGSPPGGRAMSGVRPRSESGSSFGSRTEKGKERERGERELRDRRECVLREFRKYGRWDGWG